MPGWEQKHTTADSLWGILAAKDAGMLRIPVNVAIDPNENAFLCVIMSPHVAGAVI